jgi:hypothetical protein
VGSVVVIVGVVALQAASGTLWWAWVRATAPFDKDRTVSWAELVGMGLALGTFASMLSAMLLAGTALDPVAWALPAVVTAVAVLVPRSRRLLGRLQVRAAGAQLVAVGLGLLAGLVLLAANWARIPLDDPSSTSFTDLYFFEAISRGLAEFGPAQSILMSGGSLRYHWFSYAWAGELAQTAGSAPFVSITRALPVVTLLGVSLLVAAWAGARSRVRWVPTLAVLLVVAGGYTGALYGAILNFDSPSQSMTTMWLLGLGVAVVWLTRSRTGRVGGLLVVAALASACTGGKISHAAVAAGGIALLVVVGLLTRARWWRRSLVAAAVAAAAMAVTYVWVLAGVAVDRNLTEEIAVKASTWQGLDPLVGRGGVLLGTAALTLAILARLAGAGWLLALRRTRTAPDVLFATGAVVTGLGAMLLLREGVNELWFVLAASAPGAVVSAVGIGRALAPRSRPPRPLPHPLAWAVAVAVPASLATLVLSRNWSTHQAVLNWLAPIAAWALVPALALVIALWRRPQGRVVVPALALTVAGLALTSIGTRPSVLWTAARPITTERGEVLPDSGLPGDTPAASTVGRPAPTSSYDATLAAARWLDANSPVDAQVATTDPLSALVPALTGRQMYLAGDIYQVGLGRADEIDEIGRRRDVSAALATGPSVADYAALCAAGVDYVWSATAPTDVRATGLEVVYQQPDVTILKMPDGQCPIP